MASYLIIGGAGFLGSNLAHYLHAAGHEVEVFDSLASGMMERLPDGVPFSNASAMDLLPALDTYDAVIHTWLLSGTKDPERLRHHGIADSMMVLRAMSHLLTTGTHFVVMPAHECTDWPSQSATYQASSLFAYEEKSRQYVKECWHMVRSLVLARKQTCVRVPYVYGEDQSVFSRMAVLDGLRNLDESALVESGWYRYEAVHIDTFVVNFCRMLVNKSGLTFDYRMPSIERISLVEATKAWSAQGYGGAVSFAPTAHTNGVSRVVLPGETEVELLYRSPVATFAAYTKSFEVL